MPRLLRRRPSRKVIKTRIDLGKINVAATRCCIFAITSFEAALAVVGSGAGQAPEITPRHPPTPPYVRFPAFGMESWQKRLEEPWIGPYIASMTAIATMPEGVKERWRAAGRFADVLEAEVKTRRNPLAARVVSWFNLCRVCQDLEEQMLLAPQPSAEDPQLHRALLSTAIASGEGLLLECDDAEALKPLRLTPAALAAKVESLRITFAQWHTELKPERQAAILKEAFGGAV
jgi:hypothetical protein